MAITNYTNLKASIGDWLNRADLTAQIPDFISLFEAQASRALRTRQTIRRSTATVATQFLPLPTDFMSLVNIQLNSTPVTVLEYATPAEVDRRRAEHPTGTPALYTMIGEQLEFAPVPDSSFTVELVYHSKLIPLSDAAPTNWLLTSHPDAYLYGSMLQAAPFLHDDSRVTGWDAALSQVLEQIRIEDERATFGGRPLKMRFKPYGG